MQVLQVVSVFIGCLVLLKVQSFAQDDQLAALDHCGSCQDTCAPLGIKNTCQCDSDCGLYGDCCPDDPCSEAGVELELASDGSLPDFQCHSVFTEGSYPLSGRIETAYWMVSGCAQGWSDSGIEQQCKGGSALLPVTDKGTGLVYRNKYCAICSGVGSIHVVPWRYNIKCSGELQELVKNTNLTLTNDVIAEYCSTCTYGPPETFILTTNVSAPDPRPCYPHITTCLTIEELENATTRQWTEDEYTELVGQCSSEPYSPIVDSQDVGVLYKNRYCATCNGKDGHLVCADFRDLSRITDCSVEPPTTQTPTPIVDLNCTAGINCFEGTSPSPTMSSFSLTLDIFGDGQVVVIGFISQTVLVTCAEGEVFDPVIIGCRQTLCPQGFALHGGDCHFVLDTTMDNETKTNVYCPEGGLITLNNTDFENGTDFNTVLYNGTEFYVLSYDTSGNPIICSSIPSCPDGHTLYAVNESLVEYTGNNTIQYNFEEYEIVLETADGVVLFCLNISTCPEGFSLFTVNDSLVEFVDNNTVRYGADEYEIVWMTPLGEVVICLSQNGSKEIQVPVIYYDYPVGFTELTYIGCSLSVVGCALILLTYALFTELRQSLPSKIIMNLAVAIIVSNLLIMVAGYGRENEIVCTAMAIALHYFFLVQFSWMSLIMFELGRSFRGAQKLAPNISARRKFRLFLLYFVLGWGTPLLIVGTTAAVNFTTDNLVFYGEEEDGTQGSCWINHLESAILAFLVPVAVSILFNAVAFSFLAVWIYKAWRVQAKLKKTQNVPYLRVYFAVASTTGLTWVFGFAAILIGESWAWYPFIILNSFQGFFIFVAFLFTKKVLGHYQALLTGRKKEVTTAPSSKQTSLRIRNSISKDRRYTATSKSDLISASKSTSVSNGLNSPISNA